MAIKNKVNILWIYGDLLDLYGDSGNIKILCHALNRLGVETNVTEVGIFDEFNFDGYDLVYGGPGKDGNLIKAMEHFSTMGASIKSAIQNNISFLITGNAQLLFGQGVEDQEGVFHKGAEVFGYRGVITGEVFVEDCVVSPAEHFSAQKDNVLDETNKFYGFINRTSYIAYNSGGTPAEENLKDNNKEPESLNWKYLFDVRYPSGGQMNKEGIGCNNYMGTWLLGPILAKNPNLLKHALSKILGENIELDTAIQDIALERTLAEFNI